MEWRYLYGGTVKHALQKSGFTFAFCGVSPAYYDSLYWLGTGNQKEYDTVENLPICKRCQRVIEMNEGKE